MYKGKVKPHSLTHTPLSPFHARTHNTADGRPVPGAAASLPPLPLTDISEVKALVLASVPTLLQCYNRPGVQNTGELASLPPPSSSVNRWIGWMNGPLI